MHDTDATTMTSRRVSSAGGGRVAQTVDLVVDRAVLLDVRVARRDVRLGLVVVVVADEVLDPVVGEELAELVGELGGQRLVGGEHERGPLHLLDRPGDGGALARAGDAEQRLEAVAPLDALGQLLDGRGLVAGGLEVGDDLERRHGSSLPCRTPVRHRPDRVSRRPSSRRPTGAAGRVRIHSQTSSTCVASASTSPELSMTVRLGQPLLAGGLAVMRARASASSMPRCSTSRSTAMSTGTSTTIRPADPSPARLDQQGDVEHDHVVGGPLGRDPAGDLPADGRMDDGVESLRAAASLNTMAARPGRSRAPSAVRTPGPNRSTIASSTG